MVFSNSSTIFIFVGLVWAALVILALIRYAPRLGGLSASQRGGATLPELTPDEGMDFNAHVQAGNRFFQDYQYPEALNEYLKASALNPREPMIYFRIGRIYQTNGDYERAEAAYKKVLMLQPKKLEALYELSRIYAKQAKLQSALRTVDSALQVAPKHPDCTKLKVRVLIDLKRFETAERLLLDMLQADPDNLDMRFLLGTVLYKAGRREEALMTFREMLPLDPTDTKNVKYQIYLIHEETGHHDQAITTLSDILDNKTGNRSAEELHAQMAKCWSRKAVDSIEQGDYDQAFAYFKYATDACPDYVDIYRGLAKLHSSREEWDEAQANLMKALESSPENFENYIALAQFHEQRGQLDDALNAMLRAERIYPSAQVYHYLGTLFGVKGDMDNCILYLTMATRKDPGLVDAYYNLGVAFEEKRELGDAFRMYKRVLDLDKTHAEAKANHDQLKRRLHMR